VTPRDPVVGIVTIVHGRHHHLRRQLASLDRLPGTSTVHQVVVAMDDLDVAGMVGEQRAGSAVTRTVEVVELAGGGDAGLPLAEARNVGAAAAVDLGVEVLLFLDVDCLAGRGLVQDYRAAIAAPLPEQDGRPGGPLLWCGQVAYLPALSPGVVDYPLDDLDGWASPHPARPLLPAGAVQFSQDVRLFWSLNFAITVDDWYRSGGFHTGYRGYGGEDTDLAVGIAALGGGLAWVGGARVFHQHHPTSSPPWQHLDAILRNATVFRERWGRYPMEGWLSAFAEAGAIEYQPHLGILRATAGGNVDGPGAEENRTQARVTRPAIGSPVRGLGPETPSPRRRDHDPGARPASER